MKFIFFARIRPAIYTLVILTLILSNARAQLYIQNGASIQTTGNARICLFDIALQNDGSISQPVGSGGVFTFNGSNNSTISGAGNIQIDNLTVNKQNNTALQLGCNLSVGSGIQFSSGLIDLNGNTINLLFPGAMLYNESETSRITGLTGGSVVTASFPMNAPLQYNLSNIGAMITSSQNLGNVQITRTHKPIANPANSSLTGIQRSFVITPANNANLNATLRFYYFLAELNGKDENTLALWKSTDGINWAMVGFDNRNTINHYIEKIGIAEFSSWTLTDAATPLPITLLSFKAVCTGDAVQLNWTTAMEEHSAVFELEKSNEGGQWNTMATVPATNNPSGASYGYVDQNPGTTAFYRIKEVDQDGRYNYSPVFGGGCSDIAMPFRIYPNPAHEEVTAQVSVRKAGNAMIQVFTMSGQMMYSRQENLQVGLNNLLIPVSSYAGGIYVVKVWVNNNLLSGSFIKQ